MRKKFLIATFSLCFLGLASCNGEATSSTVIPPSATAPSTSKHSSSSSPVNEDVKISQIKLTADKTELIEGETLQLKVSVLPEDATDKSYTFSSSDEKVATVNESGQVSAIKEGEVTITCAANDGSGVKDSIALKVVREAILIDTITLSTEGDKKKIEEGERLKLSVSYTPAVPDDNTIDFTSSDESIAKIVKEGDDYYIEGVKPGKATITAASHDEGAAQASVEITVLKKTILVSSIALTAEKTELYVGDTTAITATITPENATDKSFTFSSSDTSIASVDQTGLVTALKAGEVTITCTSNDKNAAAAINLTIHDKDINYLKPLLETSKFLEIEQASSGSYSINGTDYAWTTYSDDSTQIDTLVSDRSIAKTLYYQEGNSIYTLTLTEGENPSINKSLIGVIGDGLTEERAEQYLHSFTYNDVSSISSLALNYLTSDYFNNKEIKYNNTTEAGNTIYRGSTNYDDDALKLHYENSYELSFDLAGHLTDFALNIIIYDESSYNFETGEIFENATPSEDSILVTSTISYDEKIVGDENKLSESNYIATDFEIVTDSPSWHPNNTLYVGDIVPVEIRVLAPEVHLPMSFTIDEETGIANQSIIHLSEQNGTYYLTAMTPGMTTLTITSEYGLEKTISINVTEVPPESIEVRAGYLTEIEEGQSATYIVEVRPYDTVDKTFTVEFADESMSAYADIEIDQENSRFNVTAKDVESDTEITIIVKSAVDQSVQDEITITIKDKPEIVATPIDQFKESLVGNRYNYSSLNDLYFTSTSEGRIEMYGDNTYTFNYDIVEVEGFTDYRIVFSDVTLISGGSGSYIFTGEDNEYYEQYPSREDFSNTITKDGNIARIFYQTSNDYARQNFKRK